jgi:uncharacterized paraquat-inducible protein A
MYCSSCGVALARDLAYCSHCGAGRVNGSKDNGVIKAAELFPDSLVWAIVSVFVVGIGSIIGLIAVMKNYGLNDGAVLAFSTLIFLLMLAVETVFIWLLLSRRKEVRQAEQVNKQAARELEPPQQRALPEHLVSVTEHTTRAFEPIQSQRKAD